MALKGFVRARLACGCAVAFREGVDLSPLTVVLESRSPGCVSSRHVTGMPLYDYREAMRPPTRALPPREEEFEEEG